MLQIRADQMDALSLVPLVAAASLIARDYMTEGLSREDAQELAAVVIDNGVTLGIEGADLSRRLAKLYLLPGWPELTGTWGVAIIGVLADELADPDGRLTFIENELLPRFLASHREPSTEEN